jgi:hypothetical protein
MNYELRLSTVADVTLSLSPLGGLGAGKIYLLFTNSTFASKLNI